MLELRLQVNKFLIGPLFGLKHKFGDRLITNYKMRNFDNRLWLPVYQLDGQGWYNQISLLKISHEYDLVDKQTVGEIHVGYQYDNVKWEIRYTKKYGFSLFAPKYEQNGRWIPYRQFFDEYGYDVTNAIHQGALAIWLNIAGLPAPKRHIDGNHVKDCATCRNIRYKMRPDVHIGDAVTAEGTPNVGSISTSRARTEGSYQNDWECAICKECPNEGSVLRANKEVVRGEDTAWTKKLMKQFTADAATDCRHYVYKGSPQEGKPAWWFQAGDFQVEKLRKKNKQGWRVLLPGYVLYLTINL